MPTLLRYLTPVPKDALDPAGVSSYAFKLVSLVTPSTSALEAIASPLRGYGVGGGSYAEPL